MDKFVVRKGGGRPPKAGAPVHADGQSNASSPVPLTSEAVSLPCSAEKVSDSAPALDLEDLRGNLQNVNALLEVVKLPKIMGEVQQIVFDSPFRSEDYCLVEVTTELADMLEAGTAKFCFRGELDDPPVLCTEDRTFEVKEAETSNSLLIIPDLHFGNETGDGERFLTTRKISSVHNCYLELREATVLSTNRLRDILRDNEIEWISRETDAENSNAKPCLFEDLLDVVQMSEGQLRDAIDNLPVINYKGSLRQLSSDYRDRLLMELTDYVDDDDEPGLSASSVDIPTFCGALRRHLPDKDIPVEAVQWLFKSHCDPIEIVDGVQKYALNERAVCRSKASQLLRAAARFELSAFQKLLLQMLPEGISMKDSYLDGLALIDNALTTGRTIRYLNVEDLPEDPRRRLELLFALRPSWTKADMHHFFADLCPTGRSLDELLGRFCRFATVDGERNIVGFKHG